jgi:SAM-dependent methyltransferase
MRALSLAGRAFRRAQSLLDRADRKLFGVSFGRFIEILGGATEGCATVLDVGCGLQSPIAHHKHRFAKLIGVDGHIPSMLAARAAGRHHAYVCIDINDVSAVFREKSFDCVVALDVIEHFTKEDGLALIAAMERIARKRIVIFTPNGFLPQRATEDNPYQLHVSGWTADEMRALGFDVIGIDGWKPLRGEYAEPRRPKWLTERLSLLTERWFERRPRHAFQILCVRNVIAAKPA